MAVSSSAEQIRAALQCGNAGCACHKGPNTHCPAHQDRDPSLTVHEGSDGKILVNCKKGCPQPNVIAALKERNLWPTPNGQMGKSAARETTGYNLVATYEYRSGDGELVAIKGRFEGPIDPATRKPAKDFKWRLPNSVNWTGLEGLPMAAVPLWGAELLRSVPVEERVYFVEGEKAATACRAMGLLGMTFGGGASTADFGQGLEVLRGRNVVLWPDNDDSGRKYMDRARAALRQIARSIVTIFPPGQPEKGDAVEYFGGGGTLASLAVLVPPPPRPVMEFLSSSDSDGCLFGKEGLGYAACFTQQRVTVTIEKLRRSSGELRGEVLVEADVPTLSPHLYWGSLILSSGANRDKLANTLDKRTKGLEIDWDGILEVTCRKIALAEREGEAFTTAGDMPGPEVPADWCINSFAPRLDVTTVFGDGGVGKSMLTLALGIGVKAGVEIVPGFSPVVQGSVLYLDWEASRQRLDARVKRICLGAGIQPVALGYRRCTVPLVDQVEEVLRYCQSESVALVIVDSVEMAMNGSGGEGSDPNEKVIRLYSALRHLGVTCCLIDHVSAASRGQREGAGKAIGGIFKRNLARMAFELRKASDVVKPNEMSIGLFNLKRNDDGAPIRPIGLKVEFGPDWTKYSRDDLGNTNLMAGLSTRERMILVLKRDRVLTLDELVERTQAAKSNIKSEISRNPGVFVKIEGKKFGLAGDLGVEVPPEDEDQDEMPF